MSDTIVKIIHDTIYVASKGNQVSPIELLEKIDNFYNESWVTLLWVLAAGLGVVGILFPFIQQRRQERQNDINIDKLNKEFKIELVATKDELKLKFRKEVENIRTELEKTINDEIENLVSTKINPPLSGAIASVYYVDAVRLIDNEEYEGAFENLLSAANSFLMANQKNNTRLMVNEISSIIDHLDDVDFFQIQIDRDISLKNMITGLRKEFESEEGEIKDSIAKISERIG